MNIGRHYQKCRPVRDTKARSAWAARQDPHCQACGKPIWECDFRGLQVHHVARFKRADEPTNLLLLCAVCHGLHHDDAIRVNGHLLEKLTIQDMIAVKRARAPEEFDLARLLALLGWASVDLGPVPLMLEQEFRERRPWDVERFDKAVGQELPF